MTQKETHDWSGIQKRALELLEGGPLTARELARELGIEHSSLWAILKPLRMAGLVAKDSIPQAVGRRQKFPMPVYRSLTPPANC